MTNIILRHVCDLWEAEGAKLAEKAVTRLEDYKHIYDDPDDAYLTDMQHLFDQQAVEASHIMTFEIDLMIFLSWEGFVLKISIILTAQIAV